MLVGVAALIASAPFAAPALAAPGNAGPDADLIALCGEFDALESRINGFSSNGATPIADDDERDRAEAPFKDRQRELLDQICDLRATTQAGFAARARMLTRWAPAIAISAEPGGYWEDRMMAALLRDMTGDRDAVAALPVPTQA